MSLILKRLRISVPKKASCIQYHGGFKPQPLYEDDFQNQKMKPLEPIKVPIKKKFQPKVYYSLEERFKEKDEKLKEPEVYSKVNIGYAPHNISWSSIQKRNLLRSIKENTELEKKARECTLQIDLEAVEEDWNVNDKPVHTKSLAENYGIFEHLFGKYAYFYPIIHMDIFYEYDGDIVSPVYTGNLLKPNEAKSAPTVEFESEDDDLWTLILTNPDGNLYDNESEMIHWFIGNIPGNNLSKGDEIVDYMQPVPPRGTGFHRYCFVLYKQNEKIDFGEYKREIPCLTLSDRTFKTFDFYKKFEDVLTPAGLSWFQADYDNTLLDYFHKTLNMKEPSYEYQFPEPYVKPPEYFPHRRPFNRYMDLHRDPKDMQKLMLLKRLSRVHPFQGEIPLLPFPQAVRINPALPIWQKNEIRHERDGRRKYRDMYRGDDRPFIPEGMGVTRFPFSKLT